MISIKHISKSFANLKAVDDLVLEVPKGELFCFLGPNGAGKTTTIKMLTGLMRPDTGDIEIAGTDILKDPVSAKKHIGYIPDMPFIYDRLTPEEFMEFTALGDIASSVFVDDIVWLAEEGITKGCNPPENDMFCPEKPITRGQMAAFLVRFLDLAEGAEVDKFTDDDESIFENEINILAAAGVTTGCNPPESTLFCPNDLMNRGQMAAFLVRALGLTDDGGGDLFIDDDVWIFESDIDKLATAGITKGCNPPDNTMFCPGSHVTRGQMAAFLHRAADIPVPAGT